MEIRINVSRTAEETEEQRQAMIAALEFLFGVRTDFDLTVEGGAPFGYTMDSLQIIGEPSAEMSEWRRVALDRWRHFKGIWEGYEMGNGYGNSVVALDHDVYALAKMVPYLLGMPEEALPDVRERRAPEKPHSIWAKVDPEKYKQETHGNWTTADPHHHEERLPAYPEVGLEFTDTTAPVPDAFEHKTEKDCD